MGHPPVTEAPATQAPVSEIPATEAPATVLPTPDVWRDMGRGVMYNTEARKIYSGTEADDVVLGEQIPCTEHDVPCDYAFLLGGTGETLQLHISAGWEVLEKQPDQSFVRIGVFTGPCVDHDNCYIVDVDYANAGLRLHSSDWLLYRGSSREEAYGKNAGVVSYVNSLQQTEPSGETEEEGEAEEDPEPSDEPFIAPEGYAAIPNTEYYIDPANSTVYVLQEDALVEFGLYAMEEDAYRIIPIEGEPFLLDAEGQIVEEAALVIPEGYQQIPNTEYYIDPATLTVYIAQEDALVEFGLCEMQEGAYAITPLEGEPFLLDAEGQIVEETEYVADYHLGFGFYTNSEDFFSEDLDVVLRIFFEGEEIAEGNFFRPARAQSRALNSRALTIVEYMEMRLNNGVRIVYEYANGRGADVTSAAVYNAVGTLIGYLSDDDEANAKLMEGQTPEIEERIVPALTLTVPDAADRSDESAWRQVEKLEDPSITGDVVSRERLNGNGEYEYLTGETVRTNWYVSLGGETKLGDAKKVDKFDFYITLPDESAIDLDSFMVYKKGQVRENRIRFIRVDDQLTAVVTFDGIGIGESFSFDVQYNLQNGYVPNDFKWTSNGYVEASLTLPDGSLLVQRNVTPIQRDYRNIAYEEWTLTKEYDGGPLYQNGNYYEVAYDVSFRTNRGNTTGVGSLGRLYLHGFTLHDTMSVDPVDEHRAILAKKGANGTIFEFALSGTSLAGARYQYKREGAADSTYTNIDLPNQGANSASRWISVPYSTGENGLEFLFATDDIVRDDFHIQLKTRFRVADFKVDKSYIPSEIPKSVIANIVAGQASAPVSSGGSQSGLKETTYGPTDVLDDEFGTAKGEPILGNYTFNKNIEIYNLREKKVYAVTSALMQTYGLVMPEFTLYSYENASARDADIGKETKTGTIVKKANPNGTTSQVSFTSLAAGYYLIEETTLPHKGFEKMADRAFDMVVNANTGDVTSITGATALNAYDDFAYLEIEKFKQGINDASAARMTQPVTFGLYDGNNNKITDITTDDNGYGLYIFPENITPDESYYLREDMTKSGMDIYEDPGKDSEGKIYLDQVENTQYFHNKITNVQKENGIKIAKLAGTYAGNTFPVGDWPLDNTKHYTDRGISFDLYKYNEDDPDDRSVKVNASPIYPSSSWLYVPDGKYVLVETINTTSNSTVDGVSYKTNEIYTPNDPVVFTMPAATGERKIVFGAGHSKYPDTARELGVLYENALMNTLNLGEVLLRKVDADTKLFIADSNARFDIYRADAQGKAVGSAYLKDLRIEKISVNKVDYYIIRRGNGKNLLLPAGSYVLRETKAPTGYFLNSDDASFTVDAHVTVDITSAYNQGGANYAWIENAPKGSLTIEKNYLSLSNRNSYPGLAGAVFTVADAGGKLWTFTETNPGTNGKYTYNEKGTITSLVTDGTGKIVVNDLPMGDYVVKEISAPKDYYLVDKTGNENERTLTLAKAGETATGTWTNETPASISVYKRDALSKAVVPGVTFKLTGKFANLLAGEVDFKEREATTDRTTGKATFSELRPGSYILTEFGRPDYYTGDMVVITFEVDDNYRVQNVKALPEGMGAWKTLVSIDANNIDIEKGYLEVLNMPTVSLRVTKQGQSYGSGEDYDFGSEKLAGAEFKLFDAEASNTALIFTGGNGAYALAAKDEAGETTDTLVTDINGNFLVTGLDPAKTYNLVETKAPVGYEIAGEESVSFDFKDGADGYVLRRDVTVVNAPSMGRLQVYKHIFKDAEVDEDGLYYGKAGYPEKPDSTGSGDMIVEGGQYHYNAMFALYWDRDSALKALSIVRNNGALPDDDLVEFVPGNGIPQEGRATEYFYTGTVSGVKNLGITTELPAGHPYWLVELAPPLNAGFAGDYPRDTNILVWEIILNEGAENYWHVMNPVGDEGARGLIPGFQFQIYKRGITNVPDKEPIVEPLDGVRFKAYLKSLNPEVVENRFLQIIESGTDNDPLNGGPGFALSMLIAVDDANFFTEYEEYYEVTIVLEEIRGAEGFVLDGLTEIPLQIPKRTAENPDSLENVELLVPRVDGKPDENSPQVITNRRGVPGMGIVKTFSDKAPAKIDSLSFQLYYGNGDPVVTGENDDPVIIDEFEQYDAANPEHAKYASVVNGNTAYVASIPSLPVLPGTYYLVEKLDLAEGDPKYYIPEKIWVNLSYDSLNVVSVHNTTSEGLYKIRKTIASGDNANKSIAGVVFRLYSGFSGYPNYDVIESTFIKEVVTGADGIASFTLNPGELNGSAHVYYVESFVPENDYTYMPIGTKKIGHFEIGNASTSTIKDNEYQEAYAGNEFGGWANLKNGAIEYSNPPKIPVSIKKRMVAYVANAPTEGNTALEDPTLRFELFSGETLLGVSVGVTNGTARFMKAVGGEASDQPLYLAPGAYTVKEIAGSATDATININATAIHTVTVSESSSKWSAPSGRFPTVTNDSLLGRVLMNKRGFQSTDANRTYTNLSGVTFELWQVTDTGDTLIGAYTSSYTVPTKYGTLANVYYAISDPVDVNGTYYVIEKELGTNAPAYTKPAEPIKHPVVFDNTRIGTLGAVGMVTVDNPLAEAELHVKKVDAETGVAPTTINPSDHAEFTIFAVEGDTETQKGVLQLNASNGFAGRFTGLGIGKYRLRETRTPLLYSTMLDREIEVRWNADNTALEVVDLATDPAVLINSQNVLTLENTYTGITAEIEKTDMSGDAIADTTAKFEVFALLDVGQSDPFTLVEGIEQSAQGAVTRWVQLANEDARGLLAEYDSALVHATTMEYKNGVYAGTTSMPYAPYYVLIETQSPKGFGLNLLANAYLIQTPFDAAGTETTGNSRLIRVEIANEEAKLEELALEVVKRQTDLIDPDTFDPANDVVTAVGRNLYTEDFLQKYRITPGFAEGFENTQPLDGFTVFDGIEGDRKTLTFNADDIDYEKVATDFGDYRITSIEVAPSTDAWTAEQGGLMARVNGGELFDVQNGHTFSGLDLKHFSLEYGREVTINGNTQVLRVGPEFKPGAVTVTLEIAQQTADPTIKTVTQIVNYATVSFRRPYLTTTGETNYWDDVEEDSNPVEVNFESAEQFRPNIDIRKMMRTLDGSMLEPGKTVEVLVVGWNAHTDDPLPHVVLGDVMDEGLILPDGLEQYMQVSYNGGFTNAYEFSKNSENSREMAWRITSDEPLANAGNNPVRSADISFDAFKNGDLNMPGVVAVYYQAQLSNRLPVGVSTFRNTAYMGSSDRLDKTGSNPNGLAFRNESSLSTSSAVDDRLNIEEENYYVTADAQLSLLASSDATIVKEIRESEDSNQWFSSTDSLAYTWAGSTITYRIYISGPKSNTTAEMTDIRLVDALPFLSDRHGSSMRFEDIKFTKASFDVGKYTPARGEDGNIIPGMVNYSDFDPVSGYTVYTSGGNRYASNYGPMNSGEDFSPNYWNSLSGSSVANADGLNIREFGVAFGPNATLKAYEQLAVEVTLTLSDDTIEAYHAGKVAINQAAFIYGQAQTAGDVAYHLHQSNKVAVTMVADETFIGDYYWIDYNRDGVQNDPAEYGINGQTVRLYRSENGGDFTKVAETTTANDANGNPGYYRFDAFNGTERVLYPTYVYGENGTKPDLDGNATPVYRYYIEFQTPGEDFRFTAPFAGAVGADSDVISTPEEALASGFGRTPAFQIKDHGRTVEQNFKGGERDYTFVYDDGDYQFEQEQLDFDAGVYPLGSIGDRVFIDEGTNGSLVPDGLQEASGAYPATSYGDKGVNGVKVTLQQKLEDESWQDIATTYTARDEVYGDGWYLFEELIEGDYRVAFDLKDTQSGNYQAWYQNASGQRIDLDLRAYEFTEPEIGGRDASNDSRDSKAYIGDEKHIGTTPAQALVHEYAGEAGSKTLVWESINNRSLDAGIKRVLTLIGDRIWYDDEVDGFQVGNVPAKQYADDGVAGVKARLLWADAQSGPYTPIPTEELVLEFMEYGSYEIMDGTYVLTTDENGHYLFAGMPLDKWYQVEFDISSLQGRNDPANGVRNMDFRYTLGVQGDTAADSDVGPAQVAGTRMDNAAYESYKQYVTNTDNAVLISGAFELTVANLNERTEANGERVLVYEDLTHDSGVFRPVSFGDYTWIDADRDGLQGETEDPIGKVEVQLWAPMEQNQTPPETEDLLLDRSQSVNNRANYYFTGISTMTDENGRYEFTELMPGYYMAHFGEAEGYPIRSRDYVDAARSDLDSNAYQQMEDDGFTKTIYLPSRHDMVSGKHDPTIDAGYYRDVPLITSESPTTGPPTVPVTTAPTELLANLRIRKVLMDREEDASAFSDLEIDYYVDLFDDETGELIHTFTLSSNQKDANGNSIFQYLNNLTPNKQYTLTERGVSDPGTAYFVVNGVVFEGAQATFVLVPGAEVEVVLTNYLDEMPPETNPPYGPPSVPSMPTPTPAYPEEPVPSTIPPYPPIIPPPLPTGSESPTPSPTAAPPEVIAKTGQDWPMIMLIGLAVVALGATLLIIRKRYNARNDH